MHAHKTLLQLRRHSVSLPIWSLSSPLATFGDLARERRTGPGPTGFGSHPLCPHPLTSLNFAPTCPSLTTAMQPPPQMVPIVFASPPHHPFLLSNEEKIRSAACFECILPNCTEDPVVASCHMKLVTKAAPRNKQK